MAGFGIAAGLSALGGYFAGRNRQKADRNAQADELLKKAGALAENRAKIAQENPNDPAIANIDKMGADIMGQVNGLYGLHEKKDFMQKVQDVMGGRRSQPIGARSWETEIAAAPRPTPRTPGGIPGDAGQPFQKDGKWYRPVEINGQLTTQAMPEGWAPGAKDKKPLDSKYHPSTGGLAEIVDPNTGAVWHAGNIAQAPLELQDRWKSIKGQEADTAKAKVKKVTDFQQFLLDAYGETPSAEQRLDARRRWTGAGAETVGTHVIQVPQADGSVKAFEYTTTSRKVFPGTPGPTTPPGSQPGAQPPRTGKSATPPKTPGEARNRIRDLGDIGFKTNAATQAKRDQAETVVRSGNELIAKINAARSALGPMAGRISNIEVGLGSSDPTVRGLYGSLKSFAALQPALHGSRGIGMQKEFESASARMSDNPDAAIAAVQALIDQAKNFQLQPEGKKGVIVVRPEDMK